MCDYHNDGIKQSYINYQNFMRFQCGITRSINYTAIYKR